MTATTVEIDPRHEMPGNLRAAHDAGKNGYPSPRQVDQWNSGYTHSEAEQRYWEIGRAHAAD